MWVITPGNQLVNFANVDYIDIGMRPDGEGVVVAHFGLEEVVVATCATYEVALKLGGSLVTALNNGEHMFDLNAQHKNLCSVQEPAPKNPSDELKAKLAELKPAEEVQA